MSKEPTKMSASKNSCNKSINSENKKMDTHSQSSFVKVSNTEINSDNELDVLIYEDCNDIDDNIENNSAVDSCDEMSLNDVLIIDSIEESDFDDNYDLHNVKTGSIENDKGLNNETITKKDTEHKNTKEIMNMEVNADSNIRKTENSNSKRMDSSAIKQNYNQNLTKNEKQGIKQNEKQEQNQNEKQELKQNVKQELKQNVKQEIKQIENQELKQIENQELKQNVKQEDKQNVKQELKQTENLEFKQKEMYIEGLPGMSFLKYTDDSVQCTLCSSYIGNSINIHMRSKEHCLLVMNAYDNEMYKRLKNMTYSNQFFYNMAVSSEYNSSKQNKTSTENSTCSVPTALNTSEKTGLNIQNNSELPEVSFLYENVFILGNPKYHPYLKRFCLNEKIKLMLNSSLTIYTLKKIFKDIQKTTPSQSLWLLFFNIECFGSLKYWPLCEDNLCSSPLYNFKLKDNLCKVNITSEVSYTINSLKSLQQDLRSMVGPDSSVFIMPCAPVCIGSNNHHDEFHKNTTSFYYNENNTSNISKVLTTFCKNNSALFSLQKENGLEKLMVQYNKFEFYFNDYKSKKLDTYINIVDEFIKNSLTDFAKSEKSSGINKKNGSNHKESNESSIAHLKKSALQLGRFDHVLFVGIDEVLLLSVFGSFNNISAINSEFPINWDFVRKRLIKLEKEYKTILIIISYDISVLASSIPVSVTDKFKYYHFRNDYIKRKGDVVISNVKMLYNNCTKYFNSNTNVLISPLFPRNVCNWPKDLKKQKTAISSYDNNKNYPLYLLDYYCEPLKCINRFQKSFLQLFGHSENWIHQINTFKSIIYYDGIKPMVSDCFWKEYVQENIKIYGDTKNLHNKKLFVIIASDPNVKIESRDFSQVGKKRKRSLNPDQEILQYDSSRRKIDNSNSPDLTSNTSESIVCPNFLWKYISTPSETVLNNYEHVYIIGTSNVIKELSQFEYKLPVTFINFNVKEMLATNVNMMNNEINTIKNKSVCFMLYDINFFTEVVRTEGFCERNRCQNTLTMLTIKDKNTKSFKNFVQDRINLAKQFLTRYSSIVPSFPVPIPPYHLICDMARNTHQKLHGVASDSCVGMGTKDLWNTYWNVVLEEWNIYVNNCYQDRTIISNVNKFVLSAQQSFYKINDSYSSEKIQSSLWKVYKNILNQLLSLIQINHSGTAVTKEQECELKVSNFSESVTGDFVKEIVCKIKCGTKLNLHDGAISVILPIRIAKLIEYKLNNMRMANTKLKAECVNFKDHKITFSERDYQQINYVYAGIFAKWKECVSNELLNTASFCDIPEGILTPQFENTIYFGLSNTVKLFGGAIKSIGKLKDKTKGFPKILVLSPSLQFLELLKSSFKEIFELDKTVCSLITKNVVYNTEICDILLGTPQLFSTMTHEIGKKLSKLSLIIIDDFKEIVDNKTVSQQLFVFLKHIKNFIRSDVGLVATVEMFDQKLPYFASRFLNTNLKVILPKDMDPPPGFSLRVGKKRMEFDSSSKSIQTAIRKECNIEGNSGSQLKNVLFTNVSTPERVSIPPQYQQNKFESVPVQRQQNKFESVPAKYQQNKFESVPAEYQQNKLESVPTPYLQNKFESFQQRKVDHFENTSFKRSVCESSSEPFQFSDPKRSNIHSMSAEPSHSKSSGTWREMEKKVHDGWTPVPQQNVYLESDNTSKIQLGLMMLNNFSTNIMFLGNDLLSVIETATKMQSNESEVLDYLSFNKNIILLKDAIHRISASRVSPRLIPLYENILKDIMSFMEIIDNHHKIPKLPDVIKIADATLGKGSIFILEVIKTTLTYCGHENPSKDLINKLFLEVCSLHFNMTVNNEGN